MRGLWGPICEDIKQMRITPAHAGTIYTDGVAVKTSRDHPRACGDYIFTGQTEPLRKGSPPRMRGL